MGMIFGDFECHVLIVVGHFDAFAECFGKLNAADFMADMSGEDVGGCGAFAEIMAEGGEADDFILGEFGGLVDNEHDMDTGIDFGMPFIGLGYAE